MREPEIPSLSQNKEKNGKSDFLGKNGLSEPLEKAGMTWAFKMAFTINTRS